MVTAELSGFVFLGLWGLRLKIIDQEQKSHQFSQNDSLGGVLFSTLSFDLVPHVQIVHPRGRFLCRHLEW